MKKNITMRNMIIESCLIATSVIGFLFCCPGLAVMLDKYD